MVLAIDVGNTQIKWAVFERTTLIESGIISNLEWEKALEIILKNFPKVTNMVVASVGKVEKEDFSRFSAAVKVEFINQESKFPFQNLYRSPNTLGIDRMVLAAGAVLQFPDKNRLVIDAGTCITYDFIDEKNNYFGGAISPGIRLRYEALHNYTAKLPLLIREYPEKLLGDSTHQSIHSGIINGVAMEIDGFINAILDKNDNFIIILTGGDSDFLAKRLKNTIFANPNFLLEGLNQTFQYNHND